MIVPTGALMGTASLILGPITIRFGMLISLVFHGRVFGGS